MVKTILVKDRFIEFILEKEENGKFISHEEIRNYVLSADPNMERNPKRLSAAIEEAVEILQSRCYWEIKEGYKKFEKEDEIP